MILSVGCMCILGDLSKLVAVESVTCSWFNMWCVLMHVLWTIPLLNNVFIGKMVDMSSYTSLWNLYRWLCIPPLWCSWMMNLGWIFIVDFHSPGLSHQSRFPSSHICPWSWRIILFQCHCTFSLQSPASRKSCSCSLDNVYIFTTLSCLYSVLLPRP